MTEAEQELSRQRLLEALHSTVVEVIGTMAWTSVELTNSEDRPNLMMANEVSGLIRLVGGTGGMVGFSCSRSLCESLVSRITGLAKEEILEEDLLDGVMELANMLGGGMKSKGRVSEVDLSPPVAIVGAHCKALWKTDRPTRVMSFQLEEELFEVHVCI